MKDKDLRVVIPSSRRPRMAGAAFRLVKLFADICVPAAEKRAYAALGKAVVTHPDEIAGSGALRRWILDHYKQKCVVILDDDVFRVLCVVGRKARAITDPEAIRRILLNAATIAEGTSASIFSFGAGAIHESPVRSFLPYDPFSISKLAGGCVGFVGRKILPDPKLHHGVDTDVNLAALLKDRIVWQDNRFVFERRALLKPIVPNKESWKRDRKYLAQKWGPYIAEKHAAGVTHMAVTNVTRREKVSARAGEDMWPES